MDYKVEITQAAIDDLANIVTYISDDDLDAARQTGNSLLSRALSLAMLPYRGKPLRRKSSVRKLLAESPFVIYYRVLEQKKAVQILHFRHGARRSFV